MKNLLLLTAIALALGGAARTLADDTEVDPDTLFKKLDINGDGKLTASEIPKEQRKFFERLLRIGDADKDGELSRAEFDRALKHTEESVTDINSVGSLGGGPAGRPKLDPNRIFQALDKNKDGKLTRDEVSERPRLLALFDSLGKDELTPQDLSAALGEAGKAGKANGKKAKKRPAAQVAETQASQESPAEGGAGQSLPAIFRLLDTDHDGRLSAEELARAGALFGRLDRNHDGFIDAKEFSAAALADDGEEMKAPAIRPGKRMAAFRGGNHLLLMLKRADADGDGKISMEEAPPQLKKHFAQIDTNGDGYLDKGELQSWFKHRQKLQGAGQGGDNSAQNASSKPSGF